jgi:transient receptor potential cation channel subfamily C protein 4
VRQYLDEIAKGTLNININCMDPLGRTALLIAIEHDNIDLLHLLLTVGVEVGDALLHAISEENVEAVRLLIGYVQTSGQV